MLACTLVSDFSDFNIIFLVFGHGIGMVKVLSVLVNSESSVKLKRDEKCK